MDIADLPVSALDAKMGIRVIHAEPGKVVATMPVHGNTQPFGLLHGGANAVLVESLGSICAALSAGPNTAIVGVEINCTHHRGVKSGLVTGTATVLHQGRKIATHQVSIEDEQGRLVCSGRLTCMLLPTEESPA